MANDKRSAAEPGSVDNPLGPPPEKTTKWQTKIDPKCHNIKALIADLQELAPILEIAEKLANHSTAIMMSLQVMKKQEASPEKMKVLAERMRPALSLKEAIDVFISDTCESILNNIEEKTTGKGYRV